MASPAQHLQIYIKAKTNNLNDRDEVLDFIFQNPELLTICPPGKPWNLLAQVIYSGDVGFLKEVIAIRGVHFKMNLQTGDRKSFDDIIAEGKRDSRVMRDMEPFIQLLKEWDDHCEIAKNELRENLFDWLRIHPECCYRAPPSRKWSIAMQVVYHGSVERLEQLVMEICPNPHIWTARGNDGKTLLDVANEEREINPQMYDYVQARAVTRATAAAPQRNVLPTMHDVTRLWPGTQGAAVSRGFGQCKIFPDGNEQLFSMCAGCSHGFGRDAVGYLTKDALSFPLRCPTCISETATAPASTAAGGYTTRSTIKGLCDAGVVSVEKGRELLLQQMLALPDEANLDWHYLNAKACPICSIAIVHHRGHGCHKITCASCYHHFCFVCLGFKGDGREWHGCPSEHEPYCDDTCDCSTCPDCRPGLSCKDCEGACGLCPVCHTA